MKPTNRKSFAANLLMWSNSTLGSSFKVKQWLIGLVSCLSGGYTLHQFSNVLGLVFEYGICIFDIYKKVYYLHQEG